MVAPGSIRMHFHRVQNDSAQWGVCSWEGRKQPSSAWITDRFMFTGTDGFGGYVDIPLAAGKSAIWSAGGLAGAEGSFALSLAPLSDAIRRKYPHLAGATGLQLA